MANTIDAALLDDIVSQSVLYAFTDMITPLTAFSTDFGGEIGERGYTINIPVYPVDSAGAFGGNYTTSPDTTIDKVTVTMNQHKYATAHFTDIEWANSSQGNLENYGRQLGAELALTVFEDVLSAVTNANFGAAAFTGAAATFDSDDVIDIKDADDTDKMPPTRALVLSSAYYNALLKDTAIKNASNYGSTSGVQAGLIPNLFGYRVYESTAIPGNSENLVGFSASPTALAIGMRYLQPQDPSAYLDARPLIDPVSGAVIGVRRFYDANTGIHYLAYEVSFGYSLGQAAALNRMVSA